MNKVVVITGASSGIGRNLAHRFIKDNDTVIGLSRGEFDEFEHYSCDVSSEEMVKKTIDSIVQKHKKIDILINCAGFGISGATELIKSEYAKNIFDVNFFGTLYTIKHCLPSMQQNGKIINISSACALFALPFRSLYCASKSAVSMLTDCIRLELSNTDIQVMQICPGDIKSNFTNARIKNYDTNERYGSKIVNATSNLDSRYSKRMDLDYACNKIYAQIIKKKLKPMAIIGAKYKWLYFASKVFPKRTMLYFTDKFFGGKKIN